MWYSIHLADAVSCAGDTEVPMPVLPEHLPVYTSMPTGIYTWIINRQARNCVFECICAYACMRWVRPGTNYTHSNVTHRCLTYTNMAYSHWFSLTAIAIQYTHTHTHAVGSSLASGHRTIRPSESAATQRRLFRFFLCKSTVCVCVTKPYFVFPSFNSHSIING